MKLRKVILLTSALLLLLKPVKVQAVEMPSVGIGSMIDDITIDQAKWAYAKELGRQEQEIDKDELRLLSSLIYAEAGNQCEAGKQAVGIVVMNRVAHEKFEDTVEDVIYEPGQFRPKDDGNLNKALGMYDNSTLPEECIAAAKYALSGETIVVYNGIEIDMSEYLFFARYWKNKKLTIQDHDFK